MVIFGTIGLFVRNIPLSSAAVALTRGAVGTIFLLVMSAASGRPVSRTAVRKNLALLVLSGAAIGINWILLSALVLGETMDGWGIAGAVLILGSTLYSEWKGK